MNPISGPSLFLLVQGERLRRKQVFGSWFSRVMSTLIGCLIGTFVIWVWDHGPHKQYRPVAVAAVTPTEAEAVTPAWWSYDWWAPRSCDGELIVAPPAPIVFLDTVNGQTCTVVLSETDAVYGSKVTFIVKGRGSVRFAHDDNVHRLPLSLRDMPMLEGDAYTVAYVDIAGESMFVAVDFARAEVWR